MKKGEVKRGNLHVVVCAVLLKHTPKWVYGIQGQGRTLCNVQALQCMIGDDDVEVECDMKMHLNMKTIA
jgi:hypothetical protein